MTYYIILLLYYYYIIYKHASFTIAFIIFMTCLISVQPRASSIGGVQMKIMHYRFPVFLQISTLYRLINTLIYV